MHPQLLRGVPLGAMDKSLDHNLEQSSKSFTFGIIQASLILRSLNHDFATVIDVDATLCGHTIETTTVEGVPLNIEH